MRSRVEVVRENLERALREGPESARALDADEPLREGSTLTAGAAVALFHDQLRSRAIDVAARQLKARGTGYYTIASAGHEDNAVLGASLRTTDPAFLHYRSGGFMMARSRQDAAVDPVLDTLRSIAASADDPIAEGRHKVWGSRRLWVPPQTSTIASHLPKAVGTAFAIERASRIGVEVELPEDSIVCCSFGDASANHATALAGINAARYANRRGSPTPILFVCEDNGWGISVDTPRRWIRSTFGGMSHLRYLHATGDLPEIWEVVQEAIGTCRTSRTPVFLHLDVVRLWGHAGSDVEHGYRDIEDIERSESRDPLARNARTLLATGAAARAQLEDLLAAVDREVEDAAEEVEGAPKLSSRDQVVAPLAPYDERTTRRDAAAPVDAERRRAVFAGKLPEDATAPTDRTMAAHLNAALTDELLRRREMLVFGEDVGRKGGVYYVTGRLQERFGVGRVFDTLLDETTILGVAQGAGLVGMLPVPEIQYLAYVHNALDQIRGEAASLSFFSAGSFTNPMVVRLASFAYQKGFGGHFHNDDSIGALRDIPGLLIATPSRGDDAARMLRGALACAHANGRVVAFLEPIALYHERDLHDEGDGGWLTTYPPMDEILLPGEVGMHGDGQDVLLVTYANGVRMSLRAARRLRQDHAIHARVLDVRWLNPLPTEAVRSQADDCGAVLVADECRTTGGGIADAVIAALAEGGYRGPLGSVRSADSYVPLGSAADAVLLGEDDIVSGAVRLHEQAVTGR
ncbi:MAG: MFS transporter [Actinobacteria bacterium]|nr:MFS transporter [Actinomycetota bacterium]